MKPPFAYYGGKAGMAPTIVDILPEHRIYMEPFFGSGAVLFAKPRSRFEIVNDVDGALVTFFRVLRDRPEDLAEVCKLTPHARAEFDAASLDEHLDGVCEATLPLGRVDVLTSTLAIEVESTTNWRAGARQALAYAAQTGTQPALALFGPPPRPEFERIYLLTRDRLQLSVGPLVLFHSTQPTPGAWKRITSRATATAAQAAHRKAHR